MVDPKDTPLYVCLYGNYLGVLLTSPNSLSVWQVYMYLWLREIEISQRVEVAAETSNMCDRIEKNIESSDRIDQVSEFEVRFSRFKLLASSSSTRPFKRL